MNLLVRPLRSILAIAGALLILSSIVYAQSDEEQDKNFLLMYFKEKELVVESPTRG